MEFEGIEISNTNCDTYWRKVVDGNSLFSIHQSAYEISKLHEEKERERRKQKCVTNDLKNKTIDFYTQRETTIEIKSSSTSFSFKSHFIIGRNFKLMTLICIV